MSTQRCAEDEFQPQSERPEMGPASVSSVRALPSTDWALNMKEGRKEGRRKGGEKTRDVPDSGSGGESRLKGPPWWN